MAKSFQEVMEFINNQDEEIVISKQEAIAIAERQEQLKQMAQEYYELKRAMNKILVAITEYKKEANI